MPAGYREFAYIANHEANTVTVLDLVYMRPDRTLAVGDGPVAEAVNPERDEIYVVNAMAGTVSVIDTAKNAVAATLTVGRDPVGLAVDRDGHMAYVVNRGSNSVSVLDLDRRKAIATVPAGRAPDGIALASDGRSLVVTTRAGGTVSIFGVLPVGPPLTLRATFAGCPGATAPAILGDSSKVFLACSDGHQVMAIGLAAAYDSWTAKQDSSATADHLLALLDVGRGPAYLTLKPDSGEVFSSNAGSNSISEISTMTDEVTSTFAIGNGPARGVVSHDGGVLWIANREADSLSIYSIDDGKLLPPGIGTGHAPNALAFSADEHLLLAADTRSGDVAVIRTLPQPALFTMMPAGQEPVAIVVKAMQAKP